MIGDFRFGYVITKYLKRRIAKSIKFPLAKNTFAGMIADL